MGVALLVLLALSQEPASISRQVFEVSGKVDRVNRGARTITILSADGASTPIYAGPDLAIFDGLNTGDFVVVRYYDSYIVELTPGKRMGPPELVTGAALEELKTDDARVLQQTRLVVTIDAVDVAAASVTYHGVRQPPCLSRRSGSEAVGRPEDRRRGHHHLYARPGGIDRPGAVGLNQLVLGAWFLVLGPSCSPRS